MDNQKVKEFISKVNSFKELADKLIQRDIDGGRQITLELSSEYEEASKELEDLIKKLEEEIK